MGNIIRLDENTPVDDWICMSNGATDVFINVLALSGSALAETAEEKRLVVWLSEKDQKLGLGTVGFDVVEMPWQRETFSSDKAFVLRMIDAAENKLNWEKLDYMPNHVSQNLRKFREYIEKMTEQDIDDSAAAQWLGAAGNDDPVNCGFPRCQKHDTLLTFLGCQICNSMVS